MNYFKGLYFKHQKAGQTISFIPGIAKDNAFIQVITPEGSYFYCFPKPSFSAFSSRQTIRMGNCVFSKKGIKIALPGIKGSIRYGALSPLSYDIMGFFRFFPMECRHEIVSMRHSLIGKLSVHGKSYDFSDGTGYIEGDRGVSFPRRYLWIQANDFEDQDSITLSLAKIPFFGFSFTGAFAVLYFHGKEYRFATYLGCSVKRFKKKVIFWQGNHKLVVRILSPGTGHSLASPRKGEMSGIIKENNNAIINFRFYKGIRLLKDLTSYHAGFEKYP